MGKGFEKGKKYEVVDAEQGDCVGCCFNKYKECQETDSRYCYCTLPCDVYNNYKNKLLT